MESPLMRATVYRALVAARELAPLRRPLEALRGEGSPPREESRCDPAWARLQLSTARLSNERFRRATGFAPELTFEEGLRRTVPWFEAFGLLPGPGRAPARSVAEAFEP
jgi:nucleoside-diphosphate-sugar epimerase